MPEKFYRRDEITACPRCGGHTPDPNYPKCWHCANCNFAICTYTRSEIDAMKQKMSSFDMD